LVIDEPEFGIRMDHSLIMGALVKVI
jgi:hypothetical protein